MTAIELLDKTENLLRTKGWGQLHAPGCLLNRMYEADGLRFGHAVEREHAALREAANAVRRVLGVQHLTLWNDERDRTVDQVYDAIDKARRYLSKPAPVA